MSPNNNNNLDPSVFLDINRPNAARIFDYFLGGSVNFEADRIAAQELLQIIPALPKWVRLRHAFVQTAVQNLAAEGFNQFLDLGTNIPTHDYIQKVVPNGRIVFSDINPVAVSYGQSLFAEQENITYIWGDARQPEKLLADSVVQKMFDPNEKVAIGLNSVLIFISLTEGQHLARTLYEWSPAGSKIFLAFQTRAKDTEKYRALQAATEAGGMRLHMHLYDEYVTLLHPWQLVFSQPIRQYLEAPDDYLPDSERDDFGTEFYATMLSK
jgi:hypothetical protein